MYDKETKMTDVTKGDYLLIIDGSSLLSTQFYGNLPKEIMFAKTIEEKEAYFNRIMQTTGGVYTNAVYGFLRVLLKILKEQHPSYLVVTWDVSRDTFRRELYADYKGNRGETLAPLKEQFILCQEVLKAMNISQFMDGRYEADDFSGTIAKMFEDTLPVRIMTKDNDYLQLVTEHTNLWMIHSTAKKTEELYQKYGISQKKINTPDRTFPFTPELVKEEFLVEPASVNSLKGLQGDVSDNIKGVPGVGEATAAALVAHYKSVEALYDAIRDLDAAGKKKINEFWKNELGLKRTPMNALLKESETEIVGEKAALLSKKLATIKTDIDLPGLTLESLHININKEQTKKEFERLEFKSLKISEDDWQEVNENPFESLEECFNPFESNPFSDDMNGNINLELTKEEIFMELEEPDFTKLDFDDISIHIVNDKNELDTVMNRIKDEFYKKKIGIYSYFSFSFLINSDIIYGVALTISEKDSFYFSFGDNLSEIDFLSNIKGLFDAPICCSCYQLKKILPYFKELEHLVVKNESVRDLFDVELAAYLVNPLAGSYPLTSLCEEYLQCILPSQEELLNNLPIATAKFMNPEAVAKAAVYESIVIYHLRERLQHELELQSMDELFYKIEMPLVFTLFDMEQRGIRVNSEQLKIYGDNLYSNIQEIEKCIYDLTGEEFNINSPKQLGVILFEKLNLPNGKKTKTGYSTSASVLERLSDEHPVILKILEYRQLTKLKSTYADGLAAYIQKDGRIHGIFNQTVTATGRISSTEPNLQNIPIRLELGRQIRKVFIPEDGYVFLDADYSQIELRILAHMSGDNRLIEAYSTAQDIHRITASQVFHTPLDEVTDTQRSSAKAVNFGIVYGISSFGLGQGLNISRHEAEEYIDKYFETYPGVKEFLDELIIRGKEKGYVSTMFGRRRPVKDLSNSNFNIRSGEERIAMNSPIQGTAADIIKIAMLHVNERMKKEQLKSRLILQIHDELLVETYIPEIEQVKKIMEEEMQQAASLSVPLEVDVKQGKDWFEAK